MLKLHPISSAIFEHLQQKPPLLLRLKTESFRTTRAKAVLAPGRVIGTTRWPGCSRRYSSSKQKMGSDLMEQTTCFYGSSKHILNIINNISWKNGKDYFKNNRWFIELQLWLELQVTIHKEVHGVGKGGYDCAAGADNWMQGWHRGGNEFFASHALRLRYVSITQSHKKKPIGRPGRPKVSTFPKKTDRLRWFKRFDLCGLLVFFGGLGPCQVSKEEGLLLQRPGHEPVLREVPLPWTRRPTGEFLERMRNGCVSVPKLQVWPWLE